MITGATLVRGRDAILAAIGRHPYARLTTGGDGQVVGYLLGETTVWTGSGPWGPVACALGNAERAALVFAALDSTGELGGATWLHLPRVPVAALAPHLSVVRHDHWDFRWTSSPPPRQPGEDRVTQLTHADHEAINALIEDAFPTTTTRPGDPPSAGGSASGPAGGSSRAARTAVEEGWGSSPAVRSRQTCRARAWEARSRRR